MHCQRCKKPLALDPSLQVLPDEARQVIQDSLPVSSPPLPTGSARAIDPLSSQDPVLGFARPEGNSGSTSPHPSPKARRSHAAFTPQSAWVGGRTPSDSFVVLTQSQVMSHPNLMHTLGPFYQEKAADTCFYPNVSPNLAHSKPSNPVRPLRPSSAAAIIVHPDDTAPRDPGVARSLESAQAPAQALAPPPQLRDRTISNPLPRDTEPPASVGRANGPDEPVSVSQKAETQSRLLDMVMERSELRHPLCQGCAEGLLELLDKHLHAAERENEFYQQWSKNIEVDTLSVKEQKRINAEIRQKAERERALEESVQELENQYAQVVRDLQSLAQEEAALEQEETAFWRQLNQFQVQLDDFQNDRETTNLQYAHLSNQLMALQRTNVYNDTFTITYDRSFGIINGLRLGRLPSCPVEWSEINAAWGQTLFLLHTVARKLNYSFQHYHLVPLGSFSRIEKTDDDHASYELYGTGDLHFGRLLQNRRFDHAMVAFLHCLQQIGDLIHHHDATLVLPYPTHKDKVGGVSIKLQFGQEETWTRALRYALINCKWVLAFAASFKSGA
ncbi:autophagy protein [Dimargaris xerosporica]|nr:autophagy protein [Dimargaris xerosporica]